MSKLALALVSTSAALALTAGVAHALQGNNGKVFNGKVFNGKVFNGKVFNTPELTGAGLSEVTLPGDDFSMSGLGLEGSELVFYYGDVRLGGAELEGAKVSGKWSTGESTELRIDKVVQDPADPEVWLYTVTFSEMVWDWSTATCNDWFCMPGIKMVDTPICDGANQAVPLQGTWNYDQGYRGASGKVSNQDMTFGCTTGAIGKCVLWGYKPWASHLEFNRIEDGYTTWDGIWVDTSQSYWRWVDMDQLHQGCVRMARADYCGDGVPGTYEQTAIEIVDTLNPPIASDTSNGRFEAVWDATGATCIQTARYLELSREGCVCGTRIADAASPGGYKVLCQLGNDPLVHQDSCDIQTPGILYNEVPWGDTMPIPGGVSPFWP